MLTARQVIEKEGPCPRCESEDVTGESFTSEAGQAWQTVRCAYCEFIWSDVFTRIGYAYEDESGYHDVLLAPPTVIIHVAGGLVDGIEADQKVQALTVDYDLAGQGTPLHSWQGHEVDVSAHSVNDASEEYVAEIKRMAESNP